MEYAGAKYLYSKQFKFISMQLFDAMWSETEVYIYKYGKLSMLLRPARD